MVAAVLVQLEWQNGYPRSGQGGASYAEPVPDATGQVRATRSPQTVNQKLEFSFSCQSVSAEAQEARANLAVIRAQRDAQRETQRLTKITAAHRAGRFVAS